MSAVQVRAQSPSTARLCPYRLRPNNLTSENHENWANWAKALASQYKLPCADLLFTRSQMRPRQRQSSFCCISAIASPSIGPKPREHDLGRIADGRRQSRNPVNTDSRHRLNDALASRNGKPRRCSRTISISELPGPRPHGGARRTT
jgi:hypothetical protein